MALDLKVFANLKRRNSERYQKASTHQERKRLEATLIRQATKVLRGKVFAACFEISEYELGTMLEVVNSPAIQSRFIIQQAETPTQFLVYRRDLQVY